MGIFDFFKGKKKSEKDEPFDANRATAEYMAKVKAEKRDTLTTEQAQELRQLYLKVAKEEDQEGALRAASALMMERRYEDAISAYQTIIERFPEVKGLCLSQMGVAHSEMGKADAALDTYLLARKEGAKARMIDDLIWYLCEEQFEAGGDQKWPKTYLEHFPNGSHQSEAQDLLSS